MEAKERLRLKGTFRWSESQTIDLLLNRVDAIKENPDHFEKPIAQRFYNKIGEKAPNLMIIKWDIMRTKMRHLKTTFLSALRWKGQTGAGLLENGDPHSVEEYIKIIFPFYEGLHVRFGRRISVQPPTIYQSTKLVSANTKRSHSSSNTFSLLFEIQNKKLELET
ncbi:uncharacterized protein LOC120781554, partial [Bactrocera tryoni]|uniref:uncharacterized protein LOC120781554 n=1 Tax=Bactrocera tryoni TaxID=59916 RepID=UPI001A962AFF